MNKKIAAIFGGLSIVLTLCYTAYAMLDLFKEYGRFLVNRSKK